MSYFFKRNNFGETEEVNVLVFYGQTMKKYQPPLIQNMYCTKYSSFPTAVTIGRQSKRLGHKAVHFMGCFSSILNGDSWRHFPQVGAELAKVGLKTSYYRY